VRIGQLSERYQYQVHNTGQQYNNISVCQIIVYGAFMFFIVNMAPVRLLLSYKYHVYKVCTLF